MKTAILVMTLAVTASAQERQRVFVSDSQSWELAGGFTATNSVATGVVKGGSRPQTVEVMKTFSERCPTVTVTMDKGKADYVVLFDREGGKGLVRKRDKIAVFKKDGDLLFSDSTRSVGNAVQDACEAIERGR